MTQQFEANEAKFPTISCVKPAPSELRLSDFAIYFLQISSHYMGGELLGESSSLVSSWDVAVAIAYCMEKQLVALPAPTEAVAHLESAVLPPAPSVSGSSWSTVNKKFYFILFSISIQHCL